MSRVCFTAAIYPANATTNSSQGVRDIKGIYPVLEAMQKIGMPLLVHGEVVDSEIDIKSSVKENYHFTISRGRGFVLAFEQLAFKIAY